MSDTNACVEAGEHVYATRHLLIECPTYVPERTILVAFTVYGDTFRAAQEALMPMLPQPDGTGPLTSWWIAEDERYDGSDNDSAVFVSDGKPS